MTERLHYDRSDLREVEATVLAADAAGIVLDRTVFYARAGGQPGDTGALRWPGGELAVADTTLNADKDVLHVLAPDAGLPPVGAVVTATLDWPRRHAIMRMHTTLHLLCAALPGASVTGGQIGADRSRLDFDLAESPAKEALEGRLNALIEADHPVSIEWVDEAVLDSNPGLVRTLSVQPPRGAGRLRLVRIGEVDLQPCGGTHVARTSEIGPVRVAKIENKGRQNRRIVVELA